jgi:transglutaminase-like putative cysteine protease
MRYAVSHRTSYQYESAVDLADHVAYLSPREFPGQHVIAAELSIEPRPATRSSHQDHYGNTVEVFRIEAGHRALAVTLRAELEVDLPLPPPITPAWEELRADFAKPYPESAEAVEFALPSPLVGTAEEPRAYAAVSFPAGRPVQST